MVLAKLRFTLVVLCLLRFVCGEELESDINDDVVTGIIDPSANYGKIGEVPVSALQDMDKLNSYLFEKDDFKEFMDLSKRTPAPDDLRRFFAHVANDSDYVYTEAMQDSQFALYVDLTDAQKSRLERFFGFVPNFEVIDEWDIRDIKIAPGEYKAFNFTVWSNQTQSITKYAIIAFLSACICTIPDVISNATDFKDYLSIYLSYGDEIFGFDSFEDGYFQDQNYAPSAPLSTLFYVAAKPIEDFTPNNQLSSDIFNMQVGFSVSDVPFQWDNSTFASLVDADDDSALFQTGNFNTTATNGTNQTDSVVHRASQMKLQIFRNDGNLSFKGLTKSFCAVQRASDDAVDEQNVLKGFVDSGDVYRKRFFVNGLNSSTNYVAYVTSDVGGLDEPGVVYNKIEFTTNSAGACELAYNLDFCDGVAYSIPQSTQFSADGDSSALFQLYDNYAKSIYDNFTKAMDQINCDGDAETLFSPIRTCQNCKDSYKNWLCGMVFPRCTTIHQEEYLYREINDSRSEFLNSVVQPPSGYYEILPCIDLCYSIITDCPSDFNFGCPRGNVSIKRGYQYFEDVGYTTCNLVGIDATAIESSGVLSIEINKVYYFWFVLGFGLFFNFA